MTGEAGMNVWEIEGPQSSAREHRAPPCARQCAPPPQHHRQRELQRRTLHAPQIQEECAAQKSKPRQPCSVHRRRPPWRLQRWRPWRARARGWGAGEGRGGAARTPRPRALKRGTRRWSARHCGGRVEAGHACNITAGGGGVCREGCLELEEKRTRRRVWCEGARLQGTSRWTS